MKIRMINGANLNILGRRETQHYGTFTYKDLLGYFSELEREYDVEIEAFHSNIEGEIVDAIQNSEKYDAIIINPGGYTHTSLVILDALLATEIPVVEVHLSNIHKREDFRNNSLTGRACKGVIAGFGIDGYGLAVKYLVDSKKEQEESQGLC